MKNVCGSHLYADNFSDGHHGFVIDGKLTDIAGLQVCRLNHLGIEFEPATLIFGIGIGPAGFDTLMNWRQEA